MSLRPARRIVLRVAVIAYVFCLCIAAAHAELVQYTLLSDGTERLLSLNTVSVEGTDYVPLETLVQQAGGSYNALPARLRVDLGGSTAWLRVGESRVNALSIFSLKFPLREENGVPLIAASDIPDFFLKSFRTTVRAEVPIATAPPPTPVVTPPGTTPTTTVAPPAARPLEPMDEPDALEQLGTLPTEATPVAISRIVIDPGHGGYDTGVQSSEILSEETITLGVAERLKSLLTTDERFAVVMTREEDTDMSFAQRANAAGAAPGTLLISLHVGSSLSPTAEGVAVFFPTPTNAPPAGSTSVTATLLGVDHRLLVEGRKFATELATAISASANAPLRGVLEAPLRMQSDMTIITAQVELGCLTSANDAQRLSSEGYLERLATGIFNGIVAYVAGPKEDQTAPAADAPGDTPPPAVEN